MDVAVLAARLVLAAVFAAAAAGKLANRDATRRAVQDFGVPVPRVRAVGLLLPVIELAIAAGLVITATAAGAAVAAATLLVVFCVAIARLLTRGEAPDCHCFGAGSAPVGRLTLVRNAVLVAGAVFVAVAAWGSAGTSATAWIAATDPLVFAVGGIAAVQAAFSWQLFRQNGRLLERVEALESNAGPRAGSASGGSLGRPAPPFALPDLDGRIVSLEDLLSEGRGTLLFFTDPGCGHCDPLLPVLAATHNGPPVAVVSRGSVQANRAKAGVHGLAPILLQDDFEVAEAYRAYGMPGAVLVDPAGRIASATAAGADGVLALLETSTAPMLDLMHVGATA